MKKYFLILTMILCNASECKKHIKLNHKLTEPVAETAYASLEEIVLESSDKNITTGKQTYDCTARIKKMKTTSDQEGILDTISLTCTVFDFSLIATIDNVFFSPYTDKQDAKTYYMLDATKARVKFGDIEFFAQAITANTKNKEMMLHNCAGVYHSPYPTLGTINLTTSKPLRIKDMTIFGKNIQITASQFQTNIQELEISHKEEGRARNITTHCNDFVISIEKLYIKNSGKTINSKSIEKIVANNIICSKKKPGEKLEISSCVAHIEKNKLILPKTIMINTDNISLTALNGYQDGNKIFLKQIKFTTATISGFSETGYFDIKNRKLILENGKIEWQSLKAKI